ncbi:MAG: hypothetical protein D8H96_05030 [Lautropia sp.]|nr:MAG: hypothetical protein D8H96_05030 [Lautropia sp.]
MICYWRVQRARWLLSVRIMSASVDIVIEFGLPLLASAGIAFLVVAGARSGHLARLMQRRGPSSAPEGEGQTSIPTPVPEGAEAVPSSTPSALRALALLLAVVLVLWGVVRVLV